MFSRPQFVLRSKHPIFQELAGSRSRWDRPDFLSIATELYIEQQQRWLKCDAAIFLDVVDHLQSQLHPRRPVRLFAQDPALTTYSQTFLETLGFKILHRPQAEQLISANTFCFAPCHGWQFDYLGRCHGGQPKLSIGIPFDEALPFWRYSHDVKQYGNKVHGPAVELEQVPEDVQRRWRT